MSDSQRISRLTPLKDAITSLEALVRPVTPCQAEPSDAIGQVLAADVVTASVPGRATASRDGWAIRADEIADAGGYAPVSLAKPPIQVETGDEMPAGTDTVALPETIVMRNSVAEAVATVTVGDGVSLAGSESDSSKPLRKTGERLRATDVAVLAAAGVLQLNVRVPSVLVVAAREDLRLLPAVKLIGRDCVARGGVAITKNGMDLDDALSAEGYDAVVIVGGSGSGTRDRSVQALARLGRVAVHGVGITPGDTVAFGQVGSRPVLIVPGRLDAALAAWLVLGRRLLARLDGSTEPEPTTSLTLTRKVTSTVGLAEVVPVRRDDATAEPLGTGNLPLWALARANGWLLVPPESEGYPAGAKVAVNNWP
jgi:molybdopterin biosynthesis enzyme